MINEELKHKIMSDINFSEKCLEVVNLLEDIYSELGPYPDKDKYISGLTRSRLNSFFKFDDSE